AYIHTDDRYRLHDPVSLLSPELVGMFEQQFGSRDAWQEPDTVVEIRDRQTILLAGIGVDVLHAPGHTEGSVMFAIADVPDGLATDAPLDRTVLSGDVLFAGSIGRTDLAGGSNEAMQRSLREVVLPLADSTLILPGHGPATTMARERTTNPYVKGLPA
ncbi:MAG: MBL fold metallo-hydrolase, partial [Nostocoides sp.]